MKLQRKEKSLEEVEGLICPNCGIPQCAWKLNQGLGHHRLELVYCCLDCSTGAGCECGGGQYQTE